MRLLKLIQFLAVAMIVLARIASGAERGAGIISGTVRLIGTAPGVDSEQESNGSGSRAQAPQALLLGTNQTVREAIVYLAGLAANGSNHETNNPAILDQRNGEFVPRIQIARSGMPLILRNGDPLLHVVRIDSLSGTNGSRMLLKAATPYAGFEKKYQLANFSEPTLLRVTSVNGQDWMAAYIAVMPHPWSALTDENGRFIVRNVPPGKFKIYVWHEVLGTLVREVQVNNSGTSLTDFQFTSRH